MGAWLRLKKDRHGHGGDRRSQKQKAMKSAVTVKAERPEESDEEGGEHADTPDEAAKAHDGDAPDEAAKERRAMAATRLRAADQCVCGGADRRTGTQNYINCSAEKCFADASL